MHLSYSGKPVRNQDNGACAPEILHGLLDLLLRYIVQCGSGLVKEDYPAWFQKAPCQGQALPLPSGKVHAALPDQGIIPLRHLDNVIVDAGFPADALHLLI